MMSITCLSVKGGVTDFRQFGASSYDCKQITGLHRSAVWQLSYSLHPPSALFAGARIFWSQYGSHDTVVYECTCVRFMAAGNRPDTTVVYSLQRVCVLPPLTAAAPESATTGGS